MSEAVPWIAIGGTFTVLTFGAVATYVVLDHVRDDIFHPLVLVSGVLFYYVLVPGTYLFTTGQYVWPDVNARPHRALLVSTLALFLTYLVILFAYRRFELSESTLWSVSLPNRETIDPDTLGWLGLLGFAAGIAFYLYYVFVNGGFVRLVSVTPRTAFQTVPDTGRFRLLATAGMYAGLITVYLGARPRVERGALSRTGLGLLVALAAISLFVAVSFRSRMNIAVISAYLLIYVYTADVVSTRTVLGAGVAVVLFGLTFTFIEHSIVGQADLAKLFRGFVDTIRLEVFTAIVQHVPGELPYQYGATFLYALHVQWPGMPLRYGEYAQLIVNGHNRQNVTFPAMMFGELWMNFGAVGLLAGGGLFGATLKVVYQVRRRAGGYLARGLYPLALLSVISAMPTSIEWAIKSMVFRLFVPIGLAVLVAYGYRQFVETPLGAAIR